MPDFGHAQGALSPLPEGHKENIIYVNVNAQPGRRNAPTAEDRSGRRQRRSRFRFRRMTRMRLIFRASSTRFNFGP